MLAKRTLAVIMSVVLTSSLAVGTVFASSGASSEADASSETYAGTHLTVDTTGDALAANTVSGDQLITSVEVVTHSENEIHLTADHGESEGRIIITSVSEPAMESADDLEVMVDGEAATQVESMSALEAAAVGGENSAYMVRHASTVDASAEVLVAVNHFSERDIMMQPDGDAADDDGNDAVAEEIPGFGAAIAGIAIALAAIIAARRY